MLLVIDDYVEEQKSKSKKGKSKSFSIRLCDRSEQGDAKKEKKKALKTAAASPALVDEIETLEEKLYQLIKNKHKCDIHINKVCWVKTAGGQHYHLTSNDITMWANALRTHIATIDTPPRQLLENFDEKLCVQSGLRAKSSAGSFNDGHGMYSPLPFPPWGYPLPGAWGMPGYSAPPVPISSRQNHDPVSSSPASSPIAPPSKRSIAPLISEWLAGLDAHEERGRDQLNYVQHGEALGDEGILRLDDLVDLKTPERLQNVRFEQSDTSLMEHVCNYPRVPSRHYVRPRGKSKTSRQKCKTSGIGTCDLAPVLQTSEFINCTQDQIAQWLEHLGISPVVLGSIPSLVTFICHHNFNTKCDQLEVGYR
ncbi:hypothetical protein F5890DRAFT_1637744 [Lentinula detonsa]|uniref:Uncharacterized protein n=1 Tax=Lentinula detonsa TaxID=2804962 RepID=A0AA38UN81_9AGAR|nr:hypothetical protein F5890DRAFT_1637744 [Lentinula detonsa]